MVASRIYGIWNNYVWVYHPAHCLIFNTIFTDEREKKKVVQKLYLLVHSPYAYNLTRLIYSITVTNASCNSKFVTHQSFLFLLYHLTSSSQSQSQSQSHALPCSPYVSYIYERVFSGKKNCRSLHFKKCKMQICQLNSIR